MSSGLFYKITTPFRVKEVTVGTIQLRQYSPVERRNFITLATGSMIKQEVILGSTSPFSAGSWQTRVTNRLKFTNTFRLTTINFRGCHFTT